MWVFGYGSLMWDYWEANYECRRRVPATLIGYIRTFNKASVKNWGSKARPGPTLNLAKSKTGICCGMAFEFAEPDGDAVVTYLAKREGGFELRTLPITLEDGVAATAIVPIYERGKNLISGKSIHELIAMARTAHGESGSCADYIRNVARQLADNDIEDAAVQEFIRGL